MGHGKLHVFTMLFSIRNACMHGADYTALHVVYVPYPSNSCL